MNYCSDMKLGLYMKIPKRTLFTAQLIACIMGSLTQSASSPHPQPPPH